MLGRVVATMLARMSVEEFHPTGGPPNCARCGDVIGVYEPLVEVLGELARHTSRAAEPGVCTTGGACYHRACYELEQTGLM
jgi:hypothetical protein